MSKIKFKKINILFAIIFTFIAAPFISNAATFGVSPYSSNINVGETVSVKVVINTQGKAINNAEAVLKFPSDLLKVVSVSKTSSIFSLWVEEPNFSNNSGQINFNGGVPTPGFTGSNGSVISIIFKAKKAGAASIDFVSGAIRENDGLGTDILTAKNSGDINIDTVKKVEIAKAPEVKKVSFETPVITSTTQPDQDSWYTTPQAEFAWNLTDGVTLVKTSLDKKADDQPNVVSKSPINQKSYSSVPDGISYFHIRYGNTKNLSPVATYKINIDTKAPKEFIPSVHAVDGKNILTLDAFDESSGIDYYTLQTDNSELVIVKNSDLVNNTYVLPILNDGTHSILVTAYDKAGNHTEANLTFESSLLSIPTINVSPLEINTGDKLTIVGNSEYQGKQVEVILENNEQKIGSYIVNVDADGKFSLVTDPITVAGSIKIYAVNILTGSVMSQPSASVFVKVLDKTVITIALKYYWVLTILGASFILIILLLVGWIKYFGLRRKLKNMGGVNPVDNVYNTTLLLKEELDKQLKVLERIKMNGLVDKKEEAALSEIQKKEEMILKDIKKF